MKKMRKLIPALSMLLVATIMLSTATFAWFTMNEAVTVTGMEVQAKANGSLVIDDEALNYASKDATVKFTTNKAELVPVHYDTATNKWQKPANSAAVHPTYGTPGAGGLIATELAADNYLDQYVYIGTAGDEALENQDVTITLTAPSSAAGEATKAYSVAVYIIGTVDKDSKATTIGSVLDDGVANPKIVHVDNSVEGGKNRNVITIENLTIPSIVGVGEQQADQVTGLKIGLRIFVDGGLKSTTDSTGVGTGYYAYTAAASGATGPFYYFDMTKANDPSSYTQLSETEVLQVLNGKIPANCWYTRTETVSGNTTTYTYTLATAGDVAIGDDGKPTKTYYVRNYSEAITVDTTSGNYFTRTEATVTLNQHFVSGAAPSTGSILALEFKTTIAQD